MAAVQPYRAKSETLEPMKITVTAGSVVATPKQEQAVIDMLMAAGEQARNKAA